MSHKKSICVLCVCAVILLLGICTYLLCTSRYIVRHHILNQCGNGMDCACMANVTRYRMSSKDMRVFARFMDAVHIRPGINVLEFTDEQTATRIFSVVSICRQKSDSESISNTKIKGK